MLVPSYQPPLCQPHQRALGLLTEKLRTLLNSTLEGTRAVLLWWRNVGEHPRSQNGGVRGNIMVLVRNPVKMLYVCHVGLPADKSSILEHTQLLARVPFWTSSRHKQKHVQQISRNSALLSIRRNFKDPCQASSGAVNLGKPDFTCWSWLHSRLLDSWISSGNKTWQHMATGIPPKKDGYLTG